MMKVASPAVIRAERAPPLFAAMVIVMVLFATPVPPDVTEAKAHGASVPVVHGQPASVVS